MHLFYCNILFLIVVLRLFLFNNMLMIRCGHGVGNVVEENSSFFSPIEMSARQCGQKTFAPTKSSIFNRHCQLTQVDQHNSYKTVVVDNYEV